MLRNLEILGNSIACKYELADVNAVIVHGGAKAGIGYFDDLATAFNEVGIGSVLFDLPGHGQSSGDITESSLEIRAKVAQDVIDQLLPEDSSLILVGFSMGGQTVCDLIPQNQDRLKSVLLACPALYDPDARDLHFGTDEFTGTIRKHESWRNSDAPAKLEKFIGRTVIVYGSEDAIIPQGVIEMFMDAANDPEYIELEGVDHHLSTYFRENPEFARKIVEKLKG